jgi:mono/diheme cytochrome c family protein
MPAFGKHLRNSEYEAVIEYLKHLSKRWKDPDNAAPPLESKDPPAWVKRNGDGAEPHRAAGKQLFATHCVSCHGEGGKGDGVAAVALVDTWGFKITPADFTKEHLKSGPGHEDLYRTIAMGLDGTPMVGFHSVFKEEQIWELVAYVNSLKKGT